MHLRSPRRSGGAWPPKSSIYLFRTDGMSCSRELVTGSGRITFAHPTTQQQLLVWRDRPRTVMVIKKLGKELNSQFFEVGGRPGQLWVGRGAASKSTLDAQLRRQTAAGSATTSTPCQTHELTPPNRHAAALPPPHQTVRYLGETEGMQVIVEPTMYDECRASRQVEGAYLHTYTPEERER